MALVEQSSAASVALEPERASGLWMPGMAIWRLASIALFCGLWEIAGRIPINPAFPPFSETLMAFAQMAADGSLPRAYFITLQPLVLGVVISASVGVSLGVLIGMRRSAEWLVAPIF